MAWPFIGSLGVYGSILAGFLFLKLTSTCMTVYKKTALTIRADLFWLCQVIRMYVLVSDWLVSYTLCDWSNSCVASSPNSESNQSLTGKETSQSQTITHNRVTERAILCTSMQTDYVNR